jgi:archaellum component FlaC
MSNNSIRQTVINNVQTLVKADKAFENGDNKQSVARYDLAVALAIFASRTKPSLVINNEDKKAWSKEFGLDALSKSSRAKVTQISYNPETLKIAKDSEDVAECKAKLDKQFSTFKTKELKDGKTETSKDVDATTFRGLAKALPKQIQDKVAKSEKTEQDLNQQTSGDSKIFFTIIRALLEMDMSRLKKTLEFVRSLSKTPQNEIVLPANVIDQVSDKLPNAFAPWMK